MFGQAMNPIIRADGNPKFSMLSTLAGVAANIILDPVFILAFKWGMMGAAVATVIGQILTAILACVNKACFIFWQAIGKADASAVLSMIRETVFGVGFALLLPVFLGLDGVLFSMAVSDALTFLVSTFLIYRTRKELSAAGMQLK